MQFERHMDIDHDLAEATEGYLDISNNLMATRSEYNFRVKGVIANNGPGGSDTYQIDGILFGDGEGRRGIFTLNAREEYNLAFKKIWRQNTTGVGIKILGA